MLPTPENPPPTNLSADSPLTSDTSIIDLNFLDVPEAVGLYLLEGNGELALVDSGPSSCLPALREFLAARGLTFADISALLLTHIHFDHAGATGTLVKENPKLKVYVHELGARHLKDPSRLLNSATRLYGDALQRMFGEFLPVPQGNIHELIGGESIRAAGREIEVAYTPGHASHHVSYFDQSTGAAFTGDTTGMRLPGYKIVAPLTPPPDIDLAAFTESLAEIERRKPTQLLLPHFGVYNNLSEHLEATREALYAWTERTWTIMKNNLEESARIEKFTTQAEEEFRAKLPNEEIIARYRAVAMPQLSWYGLERYWRKRIGAYQQTFSEA
jgi:glyoxylase-like metal-dependent hydrolase (beta-lactamase superfamily II)